MWLAAARLSTPERVPVMSDDLNKRGGQDRTRIDVNQDYELRDWAKKYGVTPQQLKEAVQAVGTGASDVEKHLKVGIRGVSGSERPGAAEERKGPRRAVRRADRQ
jgi:hypothetical protein